MRDWEAMRRRFVEEGKSLVEIAKEADVPYSTAANRAKAEDWRGQREACLAESNTMRLERLTRRLLDQIEAALCAGDGMEAKDFKAVTGALRELSELCGAKSERSGPGELTVRFVGEAEDYSK
ncbi:MAG: DUF1804 family protein [Oscillospiraceae bacterium]|nr:DUF1804 family protein [Oscillospiraceae bacterium]